jgi:hypothetical protein
MAFNISTLSDFDSKIQNFHKQAPTVFIQRQKIGTADLTESRPPKSIRYQSGNDNCQHLKATIVEDSASDGCQIL